MNARGAVACGHQVTAEAAAEILREGGNAIDAAIAAHFAACVAEPVLASLGGGGFLLARRGGAGGEAMLFDFFAQTPAVRNPDGRVFPIQAHFGEASQTFHIGAGAIATPGAVAGMHTIHNWGASLPMSRLVQPACRAARQGVIVNSFQGYIFDIVRPIYEASEAARRVYGSDLTSTGDTLRQPELAATIEQIALEGPRVFYEGEIGRQLATLCEQGGGHLTREDLRGYQVHAREPLRFEYRNRRILTNAPPSAGGPLIQYALTLLAGVNLGNMRRGGSDFPVFDVRRSGVTVPIALASSQVTNPNSTINGC